jgi:hypothetical protein
MNRPVIFVPRSQVPFVLLVVAGLAFPGCQELREEPDDTIRGAGSIDVPVERLTSRPAEDRARVPGLEAVRSTCEPGDSHVEPPRESPTPDASAGRTDPGER